MDQDNVYYYDETSSIDQAHRDVLHHRSQPSEESIILVELPEGRPDAPRPSVQQASRRRQSTIVNASQLPEGLDEEDEDPLEQYVRKNMPAFRKSLAPDELEYPFQNKISQDREEVVSPTTAEEINQNWAHSKPSKITANGEKTKKEPENIYYGDTNVIGTPKVREKHRKKQDESFRRDNEVMVMPALESVCVTQDSPFTKEQKRSNQRPASRVRVMVSVESSSESDKRQENKQGLDRKKRDPSVRKRESKDRSKKEYESRDVKNLRSNENDINKSKRKKSRPVTNEEGDKENKSNQKTRKERSKYKSRDSRDYLDDYEDTRNKGEPRSERFPDDTSDDFRLSNTRKSRGKSRQSDSRRSSTPFGGENNQVVYAMTGGSTYNAKNLPNTAGSSKDHSRSKKTQRRPDRAEAGSDRNDQNYVTVKAPRSATKMVVKRRYHIQIPDHSSTETWFNVRFNLDCENNVEMNYEGPVKINNYYSSNNYN